MARGNPNFGGKRAAPYQPGPNRAKAGAQKAAKTKAIRKTVTIKGKGNQSPVTFQKGGLHQSVGVPQGQTIPDSKMQAALAGRYGPKAKQQAVMAKGMLAKGRRTAKGK